MVTLRGISVCPGFVTAPVVRVSQPVGVDPNEPPSTDPQTDGQRIRETLEAVAASVRAVGDGPHTSMLEATAALATDRALIKAIDKELASGAGVTAAVAGAVEVYAEKLRKLGGYFAERVVDLYDIRDRAIARLQGLPEPGMPHLDRPSIIVAHDLAPSQTAALDPALVAGIVTEAGGPTSHTAILAAQLGIPAVVQVRGILLTDAHRISLHATTGEVHVNPTPAEAAGLEAAAREEAAAGVAAVAAGPGSISGQIRNGQTSDGHPVKLMANIGSAAEMEGLDAEGVGLFRTEFLFLDRDDAPGLQEQTDQYVAVLKAAAGRRVVVRTLDAGADKPLRFVPTQALTPAPGQAPPQAEENPALGVRGIRMSQRYPELMDTQLEALANAAEQVPGSELWVMAPMVVSADEARWFAQRARAHGLPNVGVMIETPAAAIMADEILAEVDFASIGTNDLAQYVMAADRMHGELGALQDPWQPAVLRMVRMVVRVGVVKNKPIGVCGEAAGDPKLAKVLVGMGVSSLSMANVKIPAVHAALRQCSLEECQQAAAE
ncbi:phosphoenolpyruvate--protein phosphotransferase [Corynebacterium riegelii]|uniref:phosphoenolpyruvate--protein phosphotransferase n=1 Tax=Corynebacterium riegelii TaxID=156976 RepID=UPI0023F48373|nr:phosphoenolpyruvate--protein phosphotransferase [Corynebacterium riegelii]